MKGNNIPEIRFPEFDTKWTQHKLGEFLEDYIKKTTVQNQYPVLTSSQKHGIILQEDYFSNRQVTTDNNIGYFILPKGYITYRSRSDNNVFVFNRNDLIDNGIISYFYPVFKITNGDSDFFLKMLNSTTKKQVAAEAVGTGQKVLSLKKLKNIDVTIPVIKEQAKIGEFFKQLDRIISLHQQELDTLKQTKQGFLQKMFPKEGESIPEVRLPGFVAEWERSQIGETATIVRGASPRPIQDPKWFDKESKVGWLRISDVTKQDGRIHYLEQRISMAGQEKTRVLKEPHLLLSIAATVGKPVINYVETGVHDGFLIFLNPRFDIEFMFQWLEMFRPRWNKYGQPGSQVNLNSELVKSHEIYLPGIEEQIQIGNFFKQLDELIALQQEELDVLKQTKKAFLQKMFV